LEINNLKWEYVPKENPDWDFARNPFTVIKRPQGTWSHSIFSVRHGNLLAPNRDYRYQGLNAMVGNDYWKFLDCIFFELKGVALEPVKVIAFPWKSIYQYAGKNANVDVEYYLAKDLKNGISARVFFDIKCSGEKELVVKPLVDIRNVIYHSQPERIETRFLDDQLIASMDGNFVSFYIEDGKISDSRQMINWWYKLGSGFRQQTSHGVKFISEYENPLLIGEMSKDVFDGEKVSLIINCNRELSNIDFDENMEKEKNYLQRIINKFDCKKEVLARIITLDKFGMFENKEIIPEAGDFWFKQVWLRDLMEFLINNFNTLISINSKKVESILKWVLSQQDLKTGRFPNFKNNFDSVDAGLLFFIFAEKYLRKFEDKEIATNVLKSLNLMLKRFSENSFEVDGLPVIQNNMLYAMPWHSWADSRLPFYGKLVSTRIPFEWAREVSLEDLCKPALLPEVNALYIRTLKAGEFFADVVTSEENFIEQHKKAILKYKKTFKNRNYLYSIVLNERKDPTETSMALVSAVTLHDHVFNTKDLENMWPVVEKLLVKKRGKMFGIITKNVNDRTYFNDHQYHGAVVWPRDSPYLIKYLNIIGERGKVKEILESNLWHQMDEGAIFYSNELFSLAEGKNPSPTKTSNEPVPMKNPIQLWSHFCDAYLENNNKRNNHGT
jgi:glycogen debranching enzyme